ncbi:heterokaryon incompatibility protein-domain-containing protein [Chaetomium sp. MPI-CAGE-AT-0009]|nr:heterokaryon incompatibility protein-domain-containing protein [Chaetomium sp. MPI-CAGE-AT-0009]
MTEDSQSNVFSASHSVGSVNSYEERDSEVSDGISEFEVLGVAEVVKHHVDDEALCPVCRKRNFKKLFLQLVGDTGYHFPTRTLAHVKEWSSSCNFCRLTLMALNLEPGAPVCSGDTEMLVRSNYPAPSGSLNSTTKTARYFWWDRVGDETNNILPDFHSKNKIYFYLHPRARGFRSQYGDAPVQRIDVTHNIQLCFESTEPFAWHSGRSPKLQLLSGRLMSEQVDAEMLNKWLRMSDSAILPTTGADDGARVRLINVEEGRLVTSTTACLYAALSYVWGGPQAMTLTRKTVDQLDKPGAITPEHPQLGRTIADALRLCKVINYRYLWVDALCICQDDGEDVAMQVAQMDRIYQCAALTIVQASADPETSVRTPLRGLLAGSRKIRQEQAVVQHEKVLFTHRPPFAGAIQHSKWNTRGWTLQERFLSRRLLYFTDHQVFMTSAAGHFFCEDTVLEHNKDDIHAFSRVFIATQSFDWDYDPLAKELLPTPAEGLLYLVSHYTERLLSNQDDALAAFSALMTTFADSLGPADFGIPRQIFDYAFCWSFAGSYIRRRTGFPSWSWAGWEGNIRFHHDFHPERCRRGMVLAGYSAEPSLVGRTIIDGTKNRFKGLQATHSLQVGPLALTEAEVQNYYHSLLGHDRRVGNPPYERFYLHFVTTCHSLGINTSEQDPPDPAERKEAENGRVDERHAGTFYGLVGAEGTKLPQSVSVAKEWRLGQPDELRSGSRRVR